MNGNLPKTLEELDMDVPFDPFGRPYIYYPFLAKNFKKNARMDKQLNPINSDFDLYSVGRDGDSKKQLDHKLSVDDIVRASDGFFIGLAADFY
jgi:general secretion pathway protein G